MNKLYISKLITNFINYINIIWKIEFSKKKDRGKKVKLIFFLIYSVGCNMLCDKCTGILNQVE